jgi:signal transduction histidine kinase
MSIRLKVVLVIITVMTLVFGFLLGVVTTNAFRRGREIEGRMRDTLRPVIRRWVEREQWLENRTWSEFQVKLSELNPSGEANRMDPLKRWAIVGPDGDVRAAGGMKEDEAARFVAGDERLREAVRERSVVLYPEERFIAVPLNVAGALAGAIKLEVNTGPRPTLWESFRESFFALAAILAVSTVVLISATYLLIDRRVLKPLGYLVEGSARVAEGDLRREVPSEGGRDEMARLVTAFNAMMVEVRNYREHMEKLVAEEKARVQAAQRQLVIAQRLAATGTLAAGIAHEVNNPIGGMINAARRLQKDAPEGRTREYLDLILEGLVRVQETVKKILQFTPRELKPQPVDLREVCGRALDLVSHRVQQAGVEVRKEFPEDLPLVFGDPSELQQVFLNLVLNSLDALPAQGGRIAARGRRNGASIEIEIEDNGCGMTEEQKNRSFDLFYTTKEAGKGTGLGLAIVHNIIDGHNGRIEIRSKVNEGTTVWMSFPILSTSVSGRTPAAPPA